MQYAILGAVPRPLWRGKPANPLRGLGYLISEGNNDPLTAYAPTLVGWAYLDFGVVGMVGVSSSAALRSA